MSTVDEWTSGQQTCASDWMDEQLVIDPFYTNQELLDLINLQPAIGHWGYGETVDIDSNIVGYQEWLETFQSDESLTSTSDFDAVKNACEDPSDSGDACVAACYMQWWIQFGYIESVPTESEMWLSPPLTTDDMQDIRDL